MFSSLLKVSKLQKSRKHKENHNLCKINCFFFFLFGKFQAGDGRLAGWPGSWRGWLGWQAGWSWQADLDVGPDLKLDGPASQPAISSPELSQKGKKKKQLILRKW